METITVVEPTVRMAMMVNSSPYAGQEGKYVTSRNIRDRLDKELERNLVRTLAVPLTVPETYDLFNAYKCWLGRQ